MDALRRLIPGRRRQSFELLVETEMTGAVQNSDQESPKGLQRSVSIQDGHTLVEESMDSSGNVTHISQWVAKRPEQPFSLSNITFSLPKRRSCLCVLCSATCLLLALLLLSITAAYIIASVKFPEFIHPKAFQCPSDLVQAQSNRNEAMMCSTPPSYTGAGKQQGSAGSYVLAANFSGETFLDNWNFFSDDDPTHGTVNYLTREAAEVADLVFYDSSTGLTHLKADAKNKVDPEARGRDSIRLESKDHFREGLVVIDAHHMPTGCGTWSAFWMYEDPWPDMGEIDIIEGVHDSAANAAALHTSQGCTMENAAEDTFQGHWNLGADGTPASDCYVQADGQGINQGCSLGFPQQTFGRSWNDVGGGMYAMLRDATGIRIWVFPRGCVPQDLECGRPSPESWGLPMVHFPLGQDCDEEHFSKLKIVINLTFCGDWAGSKFSWGLGRCRLKGPSCDRYVRENPEAFSDAFWAVRHVQVYDKDDSEP